MSTDPRIQSAADLLWDTWKGSRRIAALPDDLRPATRAEAYAMQARIEARSGKPLFGWKIAATSAAGQAHIGVDGPLCGRLIAENVLPDGADVPFGANHMKVAEAEFAFRMARDLPPRPAPYTRDEIRDAIGAMHLAIEIPDSRYDEFAKVGAPQLIADGACSHLFVLGPQAQGDWRAVDLVNHAVVATTGTARREGKGGNVLGDPLLALTWMVNELSGLGVTLKAGEVVTTGTCVPPIPIAPGDIVVADFGTLGRVSARIVA